MKLHVPPKHLHVFIKPYFFYNDHLQKLKVQNSEHRTERKGLPSKALNCAIYAKDRQILLNA
jgi:hypothetical protein